MPALAIYILVQGTALCAVHDMMALASALMSVPSDLKARMLTEKAHLLLRHLWLLSFRTDKHCQSRS